LEVAGPEAVRVDEAARILFPGTEVVTDPEARFFPASALADDVLLPGPGARLGSTRLR
jgi:hypothetical protein